MNEIHIERCTEQHIDALTALYNEPAVARQVLQMPYQAPALWRKRMCLDEEGLVTLAAMHQGELVGTATLDKCIRLRRSHAGSIGMASPRRGKDEALAVGCWRSCWKLPITG